VLLHWAQNLSVMLEIMEPQPEHLPMAVRPDRPVHLEHFIFFVLDFSCCSAYTGSSLEAAMGYL
jgi:hypothetical protein